MAEIESRSKPQRLLSIAAPVAFKDRGRGRV
jgi:hypothetical protein